MDKEIRKVDDVRDDITKQITKLQSYLKKEWDLPQNQRFLKAGGESIYNKNKEDEKLSDITKNRSNPFVIKGLEEVLFR